MSSPRATSQNVLVHWLLKLQPTIENKLAARHLAHNGLALDDLTSSYFEGVTCPLAELGYPRDGKTGKLQVNYGLLTTPQGVPVAVSIFKGSTGDPKTLMPQVQKLREQFGIQEFVLVGDRGIIPQKQVTVLRETEGCEWISALRPEAIRKLISAGVIQQGLFDERNLFELSHPDFHEERLVACRNPDLAERRANSRQALLDATTEKLEQISRMIRPIRHRLENRVRAHIFLCMLACYVQWHMMEAWRPLLFADEDQESKATRDPVAAAERSQGAMQKVHGKRLDDDSLVHSCRTLLDELSRIVSNVCRCPHLGPDAPTFNKTTAPNPKQQEALRLLQAIRL